MSIDPIAVLEAIVAEVAGAGQPFSADLYLPAHLIHDARQAIEAEHKDAAEWKAREAYEALLLARLAKADEMIASLRAEIDAHKSMLLSADELISAMRAEINALLRPCYEPPKIPGQPPGVVVGPAQTVFDPYQRLTAYGRRQECDS